MTQHTWGRRQRIYNLDKEDHLEIWQRCRECGARRLVYIGSWEGAPVNDRPADVLQIDTAEVATLAFFPVVYPN